MTKRDSNRALLGAGFRRSLAVIAMIGLGVVLSPLSRSAHAGVAPAMGPCDDVDCDDANPCTDDRCDATGNAPLCMHVDNGTCIGPRCGNGIVDGDDGETCDPPDLSVDPSSGEVVCRLDCTACGDGIVQTNDQETCDDGNQVSGCDPRHPQRALDDCLSQCAVPICADPAKLIMAGPLARFSVHGRLTDLRGQQLDPVAQPVVLQVKNGEGTVVMRASLGAHTVEPRSRGFGYSDPIAATRGGIRKLRLQKVSGAFRFAADAYGRAALTGAPATTEVLVGAAKWSVTGTWERIQGGWRLSMRQLASGFSR